MMKRSINILLFMSIVMVSCAKDVNESIVPSVVLNSFNQQFSSARDVEWEMEDTYYNVEFKIGFRDHEAWYDSTGTRVKHKQDIAQSDLPSAAKDALKKEFKKYRVDDVKKIEEGAVVTYRVDIENGPDDRILVFDAEGKLLQNLPD